MQRLAQKLEMCSALSPSLWDTRIFLTQISKKTPPPFGRGVCRYVNSTTNLGGEGSVGLEPVKPDGANGGCIDGRGGAPAYVVDDPVVVG